MNAPKQHISDLVHHCASYGMRHIVISPGSRNAPVTRAFAASTEITCHSVVDERSAAFVALGMAHQLGKPVAVLCTSGTAPLNYGPAIAEAFYLRVPLIVLTADRPARLVDHQDSQTIRQDRLFQNIVKGSYSLPEEPDCIESLELSADILATAFTTALFPDFGPVHINIPLEDPLYVNALSAQPSTLARTLHVESHSDSQHIKESIKEAVASFSVAKKKMIVCGQGLWSKELQKYLLQLSEDPSIVVVAENTANIAGDIVQYPDFQVLSAGAGRAELAPDAVISFGGHLVSKHLKILLREFPATYHLRLDPELKGIDTYHNLDAEIAIDPQTFFKECVKEYQFSKTCDFQNLWQMPKDIALVDEEYHALAGLLAELPPQSIVHLGNSMAVRHAGKIATRDDLVYHSNRGVAGIDGCLSTAVGVARATDKIVLCCLGDLSFVYDSNGLWHKGLPSNLRVVVLNNAGGDIFRRLKGPDESPGFEEIFIAHHPVNMQKLVEAYGVTYFNCTAAEINNMLSTFYTSNTATVLEVVIERQAQ